MSALPFVTDENFDAEVLKSDIPVLVDFSAEWCGPCKNLAPIVEALAEDYAGKVKFVQVDIEQSRQTPVTFGIMGVPTIVLFKEGKVVDTINGFKPKPVLVKHLDRVA